MHSKSVNTKKLANIRIFYNRVRNLGRGVLRYPLAVLMLNR